MTHHQHSTAAAAESYACVVVPRCGRERKDELEAAWWQEHAELALGPSAAAGSAAPSGGSPTKGGGDDNMTRRVAHVAAKKQQLLDRVVSATSWKARLCCSTRSLAAKRARGHPVSHWTAVQT